MLKSYAAIYKQGYLQWLDDAPSQDNIEVIVTLIEKTKPINRTALEKQAILNQAWQCVSQESDEKPLRKVYAHRINVEDIELPTRENLHER
ncbi:MAG: hypothetical protein WAX77_03350 [Methylococcaceae bacterium]